MVLFKETGIPMVAGSTSNVCFHALKSVALVGPARTSVAVLARTKDSRADLNIWGCARDYRVEKIHAGAGYIPKDWLCKIKIAILNDRRGTLSCAMDHGLRDCMIRHRGRFLSNYN